METYGYMGKICRVNLTKKKVSVEDLEERDVKRFLGCSGYAAKILWDEVKPSV